MRLAGLGRMKEKMPGMRGSTEPKPVRSGKTEQQPPGPDKTMETDFQTRKTRGRLSRDDQRRLGDVLQRVYDDVISQGVPDRFKTLIDQLGQNESGAETEEA